MTETYEIRHLNKADLDKPICLLSNPSFRPFPLAIPFLNRFYSARQKIE